MRSLHLLSCIAMIGACGAGGNSPVFFSDSPASEARCVDMAIPDAQRAEIADVTAVGDGRFLVLYPLERELVTFNDRLQEVSVLRFDRDGPSGVKLPRSAATDGRFYYIADEGDVALKRFDELGAGRGVFRLDFVPRRVRAAGSHIVVTPLVLANQPTRLLYRLTGERLVAVPISIARYDASAITSFANLASIATFADGEILLMHEMVVPFGYSLNARSAAPSIQRFAVPLPRAVKSVAGTLPRPPITESNIGGLLAVALTATPNEATGGVFYLTRTGRRMNGIWQKMIVELDSRRQYQRSFVVPGNPQHILYLPSRQAVLTFDDEGTWHECRLT